MENADLIVNGPEALYVVRGNGRTFLNSTDGGCMKKVICGVALLSVCATSLVFAQAETPKIDQRQANQEKRIAQGVASGQMNQREADRLNHQQEHINKMEDKAKSDGAVTKKERRKITKSQDRASHRIARQKHDAQQR
jgi:peptidoglycan hydrolase CwlO-like protein